MSDTDPSVALPLLSPDPTAAAVATVYAATAEALADAARNAATAQQNSAAALEATTTAAVARLLDLSGGAA